MGEHAVLTLSNIHCPCNCKKKDRRGKGVRWRKNKLRFIFSPTSWSLMRHCSSPTNIWHGQLRPWPHRLNTSASAQLRHRSTLAHIFVLEHRSGGASSAEREVPLLCFFFLCFLLNFESALVLVVGRWRRRAAGRLSQDQAVPRFSFGARRAAMASWGYFERNGAPLSGHVCR